MIFAALSVIFVLGFTLFWLWMFVDLLTSESIGRYNKAVWTLGFIFAHLIIAVVYYLLEYRDKKPALAPPQKAKSA